MVFLGAGMWVEGEVDSCIFVFLFGPLTEQLVYVLDGGACLCLWNEVG